MKIHILALAGLAILCGCEKESSYHPDDHELAPVDWSAWNQPELTRYVIADDIEGLKKRIQEKRELIHEKSRDGTVLFDAVKHQRYEMVELLLKKGSDVNEDLGPMESNSPNIPSIDRTGYTPIFTAISNSDKRMVEILLKHGARLDTEYLGDSPIQTSKQVGNSEITELISTHLQTENQNQPEVATP